MMVNSMDHPKATAPAATAFNIHKFSTEGILKGMLTRWMIHAKLVVKCRLEIGSCRKSLARVKQCFSKLFPCYRFVVRCTASTFLRHCFLGQGL